MNLVSVLWSIFDGGKVSADIGLRHRVNLYRRYFNWRKSRCIFIHIPKVAGTSINHALYGRTLGHYTISEVRSTFPALVTNCLVFSVVRNPYSRLYSAYRFAKMGRTSDMGIRNPKQYRIPEFDRFDSFVNDWLVYQDLNEIDHVFRPQYKYICVEGLIAVDVLCRLESLTEDIACIEQQLGQKLNIEVKNAISDEGEYRRHYSDSIRNVVYRLYQNDFELFGYDSQL